MVYKNKEHKRIYMLGFEAGARIKGGGISFDYLLDRYDRLRREYNKRVKKAIRDAIKTKKRRGNNEKRM